MAVAYEALKRGADDELIGIVGTPVVTLDGLRAEAREDSAKRDNAAPRASQESREPMCLKCETATEPTISGPSGRRYVIRQTKAGTTYGLGAHSLLLTHGRHVIERSRPRWNLEGIVDRLTASLETRAKALENARAVVPEGEWPKLNALLTRWFRYPGTWRGARRRIERCIRWMNLDDDAERQAMKALNTMDLRRTWA